MGFFSFPPSSKALILSEWHSLALDSALDSALGTLSPTIVSMAFPGALIVGRSGTHHVFIGRIAFIPGTPLSSLAAKLSAELPRPEA